jgi:GFO/IDH/MocA oxidoreductase family protein
MYARRGRVCILGRIVACALLVAAATDTSSQPAAPPVRVGVIGLDTSHSPAFTEVFNDPQAAPDVAGFRVTAAYPYGSRTIESSYSRIPKYSDEMRQLGVEIVDSVAEVLRRADVVLLMTNDGRLHLEQARQVLQAGKPIFIDKPLAASLADAVAIFDSAERAHVAVFSSSSLRYAAGAQAARGGSFGRVVGADAFSPATLEPTHPDLFWYGIHGVELLFTALGTGCEQVVRVHADETDVVVGRWTDGRIGTFRGIRDGRGDYGGTAFGAEGIGPLGPFDGYRPLLVAIAQFFRTGVPPVGADETLEIYAFMEAAHESTRRGGLPVRIADVLAKARAEAAAR